MHAKVMHVVMTVTDAHVRTRSVLAKSTHWAHSARSSGVLTRASCLSAMYSSMAPLWVCASGSCAFGDICMQVCMGQCKLCSVGKAPTVRKVR